MKTKIIFILIIIFLYSSIAFSSTSLYVSSRWPYTSSGLAVLPATEAVSSGNHQAYGSEILIWALGDKVNFVDPATMTLINSFRVKTKSYIHEVFYDDTPGSEKLYISAGLGDSTDSTTGGVYSYDIKDLNSPVKLDQINSSATAPGLLPDTNSESSQSIHAIDGFGIGYFNGLIFVADNSYGIRVIDATSTGTLKELTKKNSEDEDEVISYRQCNSGTECTTTGGYIDIEVLNFKYYAPGDSTGVEKVYLFVVDYFLGLQIFDATSLYNLNNSPITPITDGVSSDDIEIKNIANKDMRTYLYIGATTALLSDIKVKDRASADDNKIDIYVSAANISSDASESESVVARLELDIDGIESGEEQPVVNTGYVDTPGYAGGLFIDTDYLFAADQDSGLLAADMFTGATSDESVVYNIVESFDPSSGILDDTYSCIKIDNNVYSGSSLNGLNKVDATDPSNMTYTSLLNSPLTIDKIYAVGDYLFLIDSDEDMRIFNKSMPTYLTMTGYYTASDFTPEDIKVDRDYAFIANGDNGLRVINVVSHNDPDSTSIKNKTFSVPHHAYGIELDETAAHAYLALGADGIAILDVSNFSEIENRKFTYLNTGGTAKNIAVKDHYAYIANGTAGLAVIDIFSINETAPVTGLLNLSGSDATSIDVLSINDVLYAFVTTSSGMHVINVSDPTTPVAVTTWTDYNTGSPVDISVMEQDGNYYGALAMDTGGIVLLNLATPTSIKTIDSYDTDSVACDIYMDAGYVYSADKYGGMYLFKIDINDDSDDSGLGDTAGDSSIDSSCFINSLGFNL